MGFFVVDKAVLLLKNYLETIFNLGGHGWNINPVCSVKKKRLLFLPVGDNPDSSLRRSR